MWGRDGEAMCWGLVPSEENYGVRHNLETVSGEEGEFSTLQTVPEHVKNVTTIQLPEALAT